MRLRYVLYQHGRLSWHNSAYLKLKEETEELGNPVSANLSEKCLTFPGVLALLLKKKEEKNWPDNDVIKFHEVLKSLTRVASNLVEWE